MIKKYHPTLTVYAGPAWLMEMFDGYTKDNNLIQVIIDPDGKPIIGKNIATDPTWDLTVMVNGKPLIDWLEEIPFCYLEETETP